MDTSQLRIDGQFTLALERMEDGETPLFITGKAGTGKSTLLSYWRANTKKRVAVLAPTGVAALNVEGSTIHSFFRFKSDVSLATLRQTRPDEELRRVLLKIDAILIDEASMVRADLLDCVDLRLRQALRRPEKAFGGLRIIFIGDLFQLPPVTTREESSFLNSQYVTPYFFSARVFEGTEPLEIIELEEVHRQREAEFIEILNAIRVNRVLPSHHEALGERVHPAFNAPMHEDWITLTATNAQADAVNAGQLERLDGVVETFAARVDGAVESKEFPTAPQLTLKVGAQVMMVVNDVLGRWVNGSIGRVMGFGVDDSGGRVVRVRLSTGENVQVGTFTWEVRRWQYDEETDEAAPLPVGSFHQFPLRLAWAVTIHKSQGKTFDRAIVDLGQGNLFAHGQLYVALSRCRTLDGLVLRRAVRPADIHTDRRVTTFLRQGVAETLSEVERAIEAAIADETPLEMDMDTNAEESIVRFAPQEMGDFENRGMTFKGVVGYCFAKKTQRTFRVDRILAVRAIEEGE